VKDLEKSLKEAGDRITKLEKDRDSHNERIEALEGQEKPKGDIQVSFPTKEDKLTDLEDELKQIDTRVKSIEEELKSTEEGSDDEDKLKKELDSLLRNLTNLSSRIQGLEDRAKVVILKVGDSDKERGESLESDIQEIKDRLKDLERIAKEIRDKL